MGPQFGPVVILFVELRQGRSPNLEAGSAVVLVFGSSFFIFAHSLQFMRNNSGDASGVVVVG
jgi:hypothetical protein